MSDAKKYLWTLPAIFVLGLTFGGIIQQKFSKNSATQKNKSKIERILKLIENKFVMNNDTLNPQESTSLQYFKHDCYILKSLLSDYICTEQIYWQLKQRAQDVPKY